jgi:hypothetical protein
MFNLNEDRDTFLDLLKPESGWNIEYVFGTAIVLDIRWLFNFILSLDGRAGEKDDPGGPDPGYLLSVIRGYRNRLDVFCQKGNIVHGGYDILMEEAGHFVHQVAIRDRQVFHPKVWIIQYGNGDGRVRFRVLTGSRNAVFGATLEGYILFEGEYNETNMPGNENLCAFVAACYENAETSVNVSMPAGLLEKLSRTLMVDKQNYEEDFFYYQGLDGKGPLSMLIKERYEHIMVFSPFLNAGTIDTLRKKCGRFTLVSTMENLAETLRDYHFDEQDGACSEYYYVKPFVASDTEDEMAADASNAMDGAEGEESVEHPEIFHPGFMHAKMYFLYSKGRPLEMILGSANCTAGGLEGGSVEAVGRVLLPGKRIDDIINSFIIDSDRGDDALYPHVQRFTLLDERYKIDDKEKLKREAQNVFTEILNLPWEAVYGNGKIVLRSGLVMENYAVLKELHVVNGKLSREEAQSIFRYNAHDGEFVLPVADDMVPGELFEFTMYVHDLGIPLKSMLFIAIQNAPAWWEGQMERAIMDRLDSVHAWYLYIFGLLFRDNTYEKSKTRRNVRFAGGTGNIGAMTAEIRNFSLERLLSNGALDRDLIPQIEEALRVFAEKTGNGEIGAESGSLYDEIMAFRDLFEIYAEIMQ